MLSVEYYSISTKSPVTNEQKLVIQNATSFSYQLLLGNFSNVQILY